MGVALNKNMGLYLIVKVPVPVPHTTLRANSVDWIQNIDVLSKYRWILKDVCSWLHAPQSVLLIWISLCTNGSMTLNLWSYGILQAKFVYSLGGIMKAGSTFNDHGKSSILSHTLRWITIIALFTFVFTSRAAVLCLCGESDSVLFPVDGGRKKEENERQATLRSFNVPANGFVWEVWHSVNHPVSLLYHTMTGIPREPRHLVSIQPHGFMFHHYLLTFGLFVTPGVCCFLFRFTLSVRAQF